MNKTDLINQVAELTKLEKTTTSLAINGLLDAVSESLSKHESVVLIGFGTFKVRRRNARKGVNPQTRKPITIPAADVPAFVAGESLKVSVKKKKKQKGFLITPTKKVAPAKVVAKKKKK